MTRTLVGTLVVAGLIGGGIWYAKQREAKNPAERYKFAAVEKGDVTQTVSANGTLNPVVLVSVGTQVSGTVRKLYVDFNDKVTKGQPLLKLDDALLTAQARQSAASVASARAALDLARANEARFKSLLAQEYISHQEYDQTHEALKSAQAQLALAEAQHQKDLVNVGYTVIRSPVAGVVVDRVVDVGQTVAASFQTPTLIKIARDLSEMGIDTSFAEADIGGIREGQKARFTVDAFPNRSFVGSVQQIRLNPTNNQNVVTYNVRINVSNADQLLLPGMTAYVNIGVARRRDVLLVPNAALRFKPSEGEKKSENGRNPASTATTPGTTAESGRKGRKHDGRSGTVYVLAGDAIKPVAIETGITDNRNTEVISGDLKAGDRLVIGENLSGKKPSSVGMRLF